MRRRAAVKRIVMPDAKYGSVLVAKFVNYVMLDGKKAVVEGHIYQAFDNLQEKLKRDAIEIFNEAIEKITPSVEVRSRRIGGATYQVPTEVSERRGTALALQWLVTSIRKQSGKSLSEKIFKSIMEIINNTGWAYKKKEEVLRMAEANKAFSSYSW
jgi:small subunit ribosomal protein S7